MKTQVTTVCTVICLTALGTFSSELGAEASTSVAVAQSTTATARTAARSTWSHYGADVQGTRFSPLKQINRDNVSRLEVAWRYSTGELERRGKDLIANSSTQTTPILAAGALVFCTPFNRVVALDPATGRERWVYDPEVPLDHPLPFQYNCRGVSQWQDTKTAATEPCAHRILMAANDGAIHAKDRSFEPI